MAISGIALLALAFTLALYPTPSAISGIPSFPFFSLSFPLLSLLLVLSIALIAWGWIFHPFGSLTHLLVAASLVTAIGVILKAVSFTSTIPIEVQGMTIFVEPYGPHTTMALVSGPLLALFGVMYYLLRRSDRRKRTPETMSRDD